MYRVLLVGYDPETVAYSDPAFPPGMTAEKIHEGIRFVLKQMVDRGWEADVCFIRPDENVSQTVERHIASKPCDCVVIGAGVRLPPMSLITFEAVGCKTPPSTHAGRPSQREEIEVQEQHPQPRST
jgi:hypothetical protein